MRGDQGKTLMLGCWDGTTKLDEVERGVERNLPSFIVHDILLLLFNVLMLAIDCGYVLLCYYLSICGDYRASIGRYHLIRVVRLYIPSPLIIGIMV